MKQQLFTWSLLLVCTALLWGCDAFQEDDPESAGTVFVGGQVVNDETSAPIAGAIIRILPQDLVIETDEEGLYSLEVAIDSTMELTIEASKAGFGDRTLSVLALANRSIDVPPLRLSQFLADEPISGLASSILLLDQDATSIGVRESGSKEVATLTFQVVDSLGRPITLDNKTRVQFGFGARPGGEEFIFPSIGETDGEGKVRVSLSSGTQAGVVQLVASALVDGRSIESRPVAMTIHGGLPNQGHFSLGPALFNYPGLLRFGVTNQISVLVGDQYSNPVKEGTAVYFNTTAGVIQGSTLTNTTGGGSVNLISGNPQPGMDGIAVITATTSDVNDNPVTSETPVVVSGAPNISVSPGVARLDQTYTLTVTDNLGNPLTKGTSINVRVGGTKVKAVGNTSVMLDDTAIAVDGSTPSGYRAITGPGTTNFTFRVVPDRNLNEEGNPEIESVTITVAGSNGALEIVLVPGGNALVTTDGGEVNVIDGGVKASLRTEF